MQELLYNRIIHKKEIVSVWQKKKPEGENINVVELHLCKKKQTKKNTKNKKEPSIGCMFL